MKELDINTKRMQEMYELAIARGNIEDYNDLAQKMNYSCITVRLYLHGLIQPTERFMHNLSNALGKGFEYNKWFK